MLGTLLVVVSVLSMALLILSSLLQLAVILRRLRSKPVKHPQSHFSARRSHRTTGTPTHPPGLRPQATSAALLVTSSQVSKVSGTPSGASKRSLSFETSVVYRVTVWVFVHIYKKGAVAFGHIFHTKGSGFFRSSGIWVWRNNTKKAKMGLSFPTTKVVSAFF
ncbi:hypothetical protein B0O99DRAFT_609360 [Bisporella sp. PMI_857]|nr:hypothetical protein B0O99DRAFT_609360 [Bisporella sp. PMI_857]